jgi:hypothetical protein
MTEKTIPQQEPVFLTTSDLIYEAIHEYHKKQDQVIADLEARAQALFARIAPEHAPLAVCYSNGDENIMCDVDDAIDGLKLLSLSFHKGATPEADYFLVANYMNLVSSVRIYTLYDLGRAMCEITEMAQEVLMTFRQAILDGNPCPWASNPE